MRGLNSRILRIVLFNLLLYLVIQGLLWKYQNKNKFTIKTKEYKRINS